MKKVLITGAGTGFGHEVAMRLALKGFHVIAAVEIYAQVQTLKREAAARGVTLQVEKLDVTNEGDRKKALAWGAAPNSSDEFLLRRMEGEVARSRRRVDVLPFFLQIR
jgi:NAD(P)-dependent dehydrogenase (short-subunit alcohol dehydrogenase family)